MGEIYPKNSPPSVLKKPGVGTREASPGHESKLDTWPHQMAKEM